MIEGRVTPMKTTQDSSGSQEGHKGCMSHREGIQMEATISSGCKHAP